MTTSVVNIRSLPANPRDWPPDHVYVGRSVANSRWGRLPQSIWHNPYQIGVAGDRDRVVALYEQLVTDSPALLARIGELRGKTLVCWCAPERCHGHVLARLADEGTP